MKRILLALDCSPNSQKAADYVSELLSGHPEGEVVLFTSLSGIPYGEDDMRDLEPSGGAPEVHGDEDHTQEVLQARDFHREIAARMTKKGVAPARVHSVLRPGRRGTARDILDQATEERCDTIVVGRRGRSKFQSLLQGSVSSEVVQKAEGLVVWVVG